MTTGTIPPSPQHVYPKLKVKLLPVATRFSFDTHTNPQSVEGRLYYLVPRKSVHSVINGGSHLCSASRKDSRHALPPSAKLHTDYSEAQVIWIVRRRAEGAIDPSQ